MRSWLTASQSVTATSLPASRLSSSMLQRTLATFSRRPAIALVTTGPALALAIAEQTHQPVLLLLDLGAPRLLQVGGRARKAGLVTPDATEVPVSQGIAPLVLELLLRLLGVGEHLVEGIPEGFARNARGDDGSFHHAQLRKEQNLVGDVPRKALPFSVAGVHHEMRGEGIKLRVSPKEAYPLGDVRQLFQRAGFRGSGLARPGSRALFANIHWAPRVLAFYDR